MTTSPGVLDGKVAIVTGASAGIGRSIARLFAAEGAKLVITARGRDRLDAVADEIAEAGGTAVALPGDVSEEGHARALAEEATGRFGGLDIAVNNAGAIGPMGATPEIATADWSATLDTNLTSGFLAAKYQVPAMLARGAGSLIFVASFVGYTVAMPGVAAYAASKAGLIGLSTTLAKEYGRKGITSNILSLGFFDTDMTRELMPDRQVQFWHDFSPVGRIGEISEITEAILYLSSDAAGFMNGEILNLTGGVNWAP
jgi:NAD(P)-dependent dehydrogenase (short-subunit alcohol dehydrogenase family)